MRRFGARLLSEPELECYTIRLPARVFRRGTGERVQHPVDSARAASAAAWSFPRIVSGGHPFARPALPGVNARMDGSDFRAPAPVSSLLPLFTGAHFQRTDARSSLVTTFPRCQARHGLGPRGIPASHAIPRYGLLPAGGPSPSALTHAKFSGLNTVEGGITRYLCTSPAFVPTHRRVRCRPRRKARYWARGARLPRRDSHPLEHAALPGRTGPFLA